MRERFSLVVIVSFRQTRLYNTSYNITRTPPLCFLLPHSHLHISTPHTYMSVVADSTSPIPGEQSPRHHRLPIVYKQHVKTLGSLLTNMLEQTTADKAWPLKEFRRMVKKGLTTLSDKDDSNDDNQCDVPTSDVKIDLAHLKGDDLKRTVLSLIQDLLPGWSDVTLANLHLNRVSGALTNAVFIVTAFPTTSTSSERKILLRIYGVGVDQLFQRDRELYWLRLLSRLNIGAGLRGIFANGRLEQYLDSMTLTREDIRDPATSRYIAHRLCELHSIVATFPPSEEDKTRPEVWTNIDKWYPFAIESARKMAEKDEEKQRVLEALDVEGLWAEIEELKRVLKKVESPIVFAHNDTQYGNILRLRNTARELVVVDFEYAGYNYRGFDIGNHFCEWTADYHSDKPAELHSDQYPTVEEQSRFLDAYLDALDVIEGKKTNESREQRIEAMRIECNAWALASHAMWGLWGLVQASQSQIEFDYLRYAVQRIEMFRKGLKAWKERELKA
ncbi:kinase-like domain-containing protein [Endogone sp. FLAS-F59071]|nr:kinase-like domain-containing protein [Endogone sp. FLAS-F59071]|eukprot:RUS14267.1 kinase-like domain-containing protein [Endogone sp. FLAS-F59071]